MRIYIFANTVTSSLKQFPSPILFHFHPVILFLTLFLPSNTLINYRQENNEQKIQSVNWFQA